MRQPKMRLRIVPSKTMDDWAKQKPEEHQKVRLSRIARFNYEPSNWKTGFLKVSGRASEKRLRMGQAAKADLARFKKANTRSLGFVTGKTYQQLMGTSEDQELWISETAEEVTIGCDPEFVLVNEDGSAQYAHQVTGLHFDSEVGHDGPCAEIRPKPSKNVNTLIQTIESLLRNPSHVNCIANFKWTGGASYKSPSMSKRYPIGGHIHLGLPKIPNHTWDRYNDTTNMLQRRVVRILDDLVALPLIRIDTPYPDARRNQNYGKYGDIKVESYKLEWRVLSGLWLVHPTLAKVVLATTKAVAEEVWKKLADNDHKLSWMRSDSLTKAFGCNADENTRNLINNATKKDVSKDRVKNILKQMKTMTTYQAYQNDIDEFFSICLSDNIGLIGPKLELRRGWLEDGKL
ncbi:MAG TPA: hypothetical protein ENI23_00110 [bacterium]|nr:hypothetical protein [bacterium]